MDRGPAHSHSPVPTATTAPGTPSPAPPRPPHGPAARSFPARRFGKDRGDRQAASPNPDSPAQPAARSPELGAGSRGPRAPAPTRPAAVPGRPPGHSPAARALGGVRARVSGCGSSGSDPGRSPYSEAIELQRLCLQGLSPARSLEKHFRGSGRGKGFGTGTARGQERPGLPGGAGRGGASPPASATPPPDCP